MLSSLPDNLLTSMDFSTALVAFVVSVVTTLILIKFPSLEDPNHRSAHNTPTPSSGGVAIMVGFMAGLLTYTGLDLFGGFLNKPLLTLIFSSLLLGVVGWIDDVRGLTWFTRLMVQLILSISIVANGIVIEHITAPEIGRVELGVWGQIISVFWIMAFTNAFNFMDGINGLTGSSTLVALIGLVFLHDGLVSTSLLVFILPFAVLGFLSFNFPFGRIFMGDAGSQFLGMLLAGLGLYLPISDQDFSQLAMPMLFMIFLYDTGLTMILRVRKGLSVAKPHRDFFFHILNRLGWSHVQVTALHVGFAVIQVAIVWYMQYVIKHFHIFLFLPMVVVYTVYAIIVVRTARKKGVLLYQS